MDHARERFHRRLGVDRQRGFVDRGRGVGRHYRCPDQRPNPLVHDDREMAELRLEPVAAGGRGEIRDELQRVDPGRFGLVHVRPNRRNFRIEKDRTRNCAVVGLDVLAERHPDREPALVVADVREELRARGIADQIHVVSDPQPAVRLEPAGLDADVLQTQIAQIELPAEGHDNPLAFDETAVAELYDVRLIVPGAGTDFRGTLNQAQFHAFVAEDSRGGLAGAGVILVQESIVRVDERRLDTEPREHGRKLYACRSPAEDHDASWQLPRRSRFHVRPRMRVGEPFDVGHLGP